MIPEFQKKFFQCGLCALCFLGVLFSNGCGKPAASTKDSTTAPEEAAVSTDASPTKLVGPGKDEKSCFACKGDGAVPCHAGCVSGKMDCPNPCLKLSRGAWIHMEVAGHDPNELWQKFPNQSGLGGYQAWTQGHLGEVIQYQNGVAANVGKCTVCGGTTKVTCKTCAGTGKQTCEVC